MTPEELAALATLAYHDGLLDESMQGGTIGDWLFPDGVVDITSLTDDEGNSMAPTGYTDEQWEQFLNHIADDPDLMRLTISNVEVNEYDGSAMITFVDESTRQAVVAYEGTSTPEGWREDLRSGYGITSSNEESLRYAEERCAELGEGYYVYSTGHSKGGCEAALAAVECPGIDAGYAFDAPGNAEAYFADPAHATAIRDNAHKVTYYSNENCFVSGANTRYGAREYWLSSGYDEWSGMEGLRGILGFSPMSHSTLHLFDEEWGFSYADGPSAHTVEINRLSRWLETHLPEEDCTYLFDALGELVAGGQDEDIGTLETLRHLTPKAVGILLASLEEYPHTAELMDALLEDGWMGALAEGPGSDALSWIARNAPWALAIARAFPGLADLIVVLGVMLGAGYVKAVMEERDAARGRLLAKGGLAALARRAGEVAAALHVHDFSEERLAQLEALASRYRGLRLPPVSDGWGRRYGDLPFFRWVHVAFMGRLVSAVGDLLDGEVESAMRTVRERFHEAWAADARSAGVVAEAAERAHEAATLLGQLT